MAKTPREWVEGGFNIPGDAMRAALDACAATRRECRTCELAHHVGSGMGCPLAAVARYNKKLKDIHEWLDGREGFRENNNRPTAEAKARWLAAAMKELELYDPLYADLLKVKELSNAKKDNKGN